MRKQVIMLYAALLVSALSAGAFAQFVAPPLPEPGDAPAGSPVAKYGWLTATGGYLRGSASGTTTNIQLKGISLFWSNGRDGGTQMYNEGAIGWLAHDWQIDVIRAAMGPTSKEMSNPGYTDGDSAGQVNLVRTVVDAAIRRGIYVVIDWHSHDAENYTNKAETFFRDMVRAYGKYPNVIYETYNEPVNQSWATVKNYSNTVISAIRTAETSSGVTKRNLIVVGSPQWSSTPQNATGNGNAVTDVGNNVAYSLHFYAGTGAHDSYRGNLTTAKNAGLTVIVTEFGTCDASGNSNYSESSTRTWLSFLAENKVSWMNWSLNKKNETASILTASSSTAGGWAKNDLSTSGQLIREYFPSASTKTYTVTVTNPISGGTIVKTPTGNSHAYGADITLTAVASPGWELQSWTGNAQGGDTSISTRINGLNLAVSAEFYNGGVVKNGHFTYNITNWAREAANSGAGAATIKNGEIEVNVTATGSPAAAANYRLAQTNISLEQGKKYKLTFDARAASARTITVNVANNSRSLMLATKDVDVGTSKGTFTLDFDFTRASLTRGARVEFLVGERTGAVTIDNVKMVENGPATGVAPAAFASQRQSWSVARANGALTLRGPAEAGAKVSLYDIRGKAIMNLAARDGLSIGAGIPAGNYFLVVKNRAGGEVYRTNVLMVK